MGLMDSKHGRKPMSMEEKMGERRVCWGPWLGLLARETGSPLSCSCAWHPYQRLSCGPAWLLGFQLSHQLSRWEVDGKEGAAPAFVT